MVMREVRSRRRNQPAPPGVVFDDLYDPHRQPARPWLHLRDGEIGPIVIDAGRPDYVVWSSLWAERPDAMIRFDLAGAGGGTDLRWTLYVDDPLPDPSFAKYMGKRVGELINANLRYTYGQ